MDPVPDPLLPRKKIIALEIEPGTSSVARNSDHWTAEAASGRTTEHIFSCCTSQLSFSCPKACLTLKPREGIAGRLRTMDRTLCGHMRPGAVLDLGIARIEFPEPTSFVKNINNDVHSDRWCSLKS
jgi:hypothetical protein